MTTRSQLSFRPVATIALLALGGGACATAGSPSPAPAQSVQAAPVTTAPATTAPATTEVASRGPASAATAPRAPGGCRSAADCGAGRVCAFEHAGCDAPEGRCVERPMVACAAAFPIATCTGAFAYACTSVAPEVPWFSRDDGKPHFPFTQGKGPADVYGAIGEVVVYHVPDEISADVAMDPARLERHPSVERRASSAGDDLQTARALLATLVGTPRDHGGDERWEIVFMGRNGQRLTAIAVDKFGAAGEVDGRGVAFPHQGTLLALKALAAHMPVVKKP